MLDVAKTVLYLSVGGHEYPALYVRGDCNTAIAFFVYLLFSL